MMSLTITATLSSIGELTIRRERERHTRMPSFCRQREATLTPPRRCWCRTANWRCARARGGRVLGVEASGVQPFRAHRQAARARGGCVLSFKSSNSSELRDLEQTLNMHRTEDSSLWSTACRWDPHNKKRCFVQKLFEHPFSKSMKVKDINK